MAMTAEFSPCGRFRGLLWEQWDPSLPMLAWCLCNPSVAGQRNEDGSLKDDPTWRKGRGFSERNGYGGQVFCNPWDYCATDFADLKRAGYPVSPENDASILRACAMGDGTVVVAWGANGRGLSRPAEVLKLIRSHGYKTRSLGVLADGLPRHPLMLSYATPLTEF